MSQCKQGRRHGPIAWQIRETRSAVTAVAFVLLSLILGIIGTIRFVEARQHDQMCMWCGQEAKQRRDAVLDATAPIRRKPRRTRQRSLPTSCGFTRRTKRMRPTPCAFVRKGRKATPRSIWRKHTKHYSQARWLSPRTCGRVIPCRHKCSSAITPPVRFRHAISPGTSTTACAKRSARCSAVPAVDSRSASPLARTASCWPPAAPRALCIFGIWVPGVWPPLHGSQERR